MLLDLYIIMTSMEDDKRVQRLEKKVKRLEKETTVKIETLRFYNSILQTVVLEQKKLSKLQERVDDLSTKKMDRKFFIESPLLGIKDRVELIEKYLTKQYKDYSTKSS